MLPHLGRSIVRTVYPDAFLEVPSTVANDALKPPIFLLGNVRSGTSMMHDLFDQHPEVTSWYEPRTVWTYAAPARAHDIFDASDATPRVRKYIRKRFLQRQREHGDLRVMEKTPSNLLRIPYVRAIFPESKYLYMVREPLAYLSSSELKWRTPISVARAVHRMKETPKTHLPYYLARFARDHFRRKVLKRRHVSVWGVRYPGIMDDVKALTAEEVIAKQWVACSQQARKDLAELGDDVVIRMRYEDFVADPVNQFERILNHFDLQMTDALATHLRSTVDPGRQQKWKRLDPEVVARCLPILEDEMATHGYTVPDEIELPSQTSS